jgi:hypothetical protein
MKFTVNTLNNDILFTGTKQECMHFIKCSKLNRKEITIQKLEHKSIPSEEIPVEEIYNKPMPHATIPITEDNPPPIPLYKRIFTK